MFNDYLSGVNEHEQIQDLVDDAHNYKQYNKIK